MSAPAAVQPASPSARLIFAGIVGNVMEWYDFAIYGYFAALIGSLYFPSKDASISLIAAFGVFAIGYLMRPLGGLLFGHIGDRLGRRRALILSSLTMGIPTALIGLMPTFDQIGLLAPLGIMLLRIVQGLSVGGEYTGSSVFVIEHAPAERRGFFGSWVVWGAVAGIVLGSGVGALINSLIPQPALSHWGWRLPFLAGILIAGYSYILRRGIDGEDVPAKRERLPIATAFRHHGWSMLQAAGLSLTNAIAFYTLFVYVVTYIEQFDKLSPARALDINTLNMALMLVLIPLFGRLSDWIGRKGVAIGAALALAAFAWPCFALIDSGVPQLIFFGQLLFAVLIAAYISVNPVMLVEAFPPAVRCSAVSTSYNVVLGLFGGTAPIVAAYLIQRSHNDLAPAYYIMVAGFISAASIFTMKETAPAAQDDQDPDDE